MFSLLTTLIMKIKHHGDLQTISTFGPARDGLGCVIVAIDVVDSEPI